MNEENHRDQPISPLFTVLGSLVVWFGAYALISTGTFAAEWVYGALLAIILVLIATGAVHKTIVVMIGSGVTLFLAAAQGHLGGHHGGLPAYVHMVEWSAVGIIIGATIFVELASQSGVFGYLSISLLKLSRGRPILLLFFFAFLTLLFAAFLDNVTAMIIVGSLTIISTRKLDLNPIPFVVTEALMTNIGGTMTLISSIPNIIIGTSAELSYVYIFYMMTPYAVASLLLSIGAAVVIFPDTFWKSETEDEKEEKAKKVTEFDAKETIADPTFFVVSIVSVLGFIAAFALHGVVPVIKRLPLEWIALGFGTLMLIVYPADVEDTLEDIEWNLIFFFVGLFTIVGVMKEVGVLHAIGVAMKPYLSSGQFSGPSFLMWFSAFASGAMNNIPLSAMLSEIIKSMDMVLGKGLFWWALILGSNLGGNITSIGSVSTMVGVTVLRQEGIDITFMEFVKIGAIFAFLQLVLANAYLFLLMML